MARQLFIGNRQKCRAINLRHFRKAVDTFLSELLALEDYDLTVVLVAAPEMTRLNEKFLGHAGSTDVIAFDYSEKGRPRKSSRGNKNKKVAEAAEVRGEIYICVKEALIQARRFRTTWQNECIRYLIHAVLHLLGHDDKKTQLRRKMKRVENRLLKQLSNRVDLQSGKSKS